MSEYDMGHQIAQMESSIPLVHTGEGRILEIEPGVIDRMQVMLRDGNVLKGVVPESDLIRRSFMEDVYREQ
jgi:hypothetical protein